MLMFGEQRTRPLRNAIEIELCEDCAARRPDAVGFGVASASAVAAASLPNARGEEHCVRAFAAATAYEC